MKKRPTESTLLRWAKEVKNGTASKTTKEKLVAYVWEVNRVTGFRPQRLMDAYFKVAHEFPCIGQKDALADKYFGKEK